MWRLDDDNLPEHYIVSAASNPPLLDPTKCKYACHRCLQFKKFDFFSNTQRYYRPEPWCSKCMESKRMGKIERTVFVRKYSVSDAVTICTQENVSQMHVKPGSCYERLDFQLRTEVTCSKIIPDILQRDTELYFSRTLWKSFQDWGWPDIVVETLFEFMEPPGVTDVPLQHFALSFPFRFKDYIPEFTVANNVAFHYTHRLSEVGPFRVLLQKADISRSSDVRTDGVVINLFARPRDFFIISLVEIPEPTVCWSTQGSIQNDFGLILASNAISEWPPKLPSKKSWGTELPVASIYKVKKWRRQYLPFLVESPSTYNMDEREWGHWNLPPHSVTQNCVKNHWMCDTGVCRSRFKTTATIPMTSITVEESFCKPEGLQVGWDVALRCVSKTGRGDSISEKGTIVEVSEMTVTVQIKFEHCMHMDKTHIWCVSSVTRLGKNWNIFSPRSPPQVTWEIAVEENQKRRLLHGDNVV